MKTIVIVLLVFAILLMSLDDKTHSGIPQLIGLSLIVLASIIDYKYIIGKRISK